MAMKRKSKKSVRTIPKIDTLKQINLNAAGIDVGSSELWVCVPEGRTEESVRIFQTFTRDLHEIANWLKACGVTTVAMESTGIYWIPCYEILVAAGFEVKLVNARKVKNVTGVRGRRRRAPHGGKWIPAQGSEKRDVIIHGQQTDRPQCR